MIRIEKVTSYGLEEAIRGMRNPMNSWDKSDSGEGCCKSTNYTRFVLCDNCSDECVGNALCDRENAYFQAGKDDISLMTNLAHSGKDHAKYRRMITVYADIIAPLYWWKEFDTYKVGTVANSCSTMHKIADKEFTLEDFSIEHLYYDNLRFFKELIGRLNWCRELYLETKIKDDWWQMIQLLPSSYNQKRTVMFNYEVLTNIYNSRKNHKLDEWRDFCKWIKELPYSNIITLEEEDNDE